MRENRYRSEDLERFARAVLVSLRVPERDAELVSDSLIRSNLAGIDSHGISRLTIYAKRVREGRIAAKPEIRITRSGAVLRVDGGNGLGQVVAMRALEAAIPVAEQSGLAGIAIRRSNHYGAASYFCEWACRKNRALMALTNSPPGIPPHGGKKAFLGTNPIAFGFPTRQGPPLIVDMSSSVVARGKIILAAREGKAIPPGWAIDREGRETTDPVEALQGAVLPFGGVKGYALAAAVEVLSGVLSGAAFGPHVRNLYEEGHAAADVGHFFILMDLSRWMPIDVYFRRIEQFLRELKSVPRAEGAEEILYPGEGRERRIRRRLKEGIPLSREVVSDLEELGRSCDVSFPAPIGGEAEGNQG
ncbi:malate dehydrogenase (NAD) [Planifilum fimeticola]|mgnify:CR=1 FL=1|uniref:Malate dehydrogenase (NAD) n=1 Tax=Planifilum fimeticola TaxID=201975 RepID=A0A2T0LIQ1_9BACL|nr:Ldh family oxidoreductase [Planifilum fimeticola]PRX42323.1 malate dehydrogenase (NAD) [Planifilum fimeticola]